MPTVDLEENDFDEPEDEGIDGEFVGDSYEDEDE